MDEEIGLTDKGANEQETGRVNCQCETPGYVDVFDMTHSNSLVVATNKAEFVYILQWCKDAGLLPPYIGNYDDFPIALSVNGGGWTNYMDRAVYYIRFKDFVDVAT